MAGIRYCKKLAAIILALCCMLLSFPGASFASATGDDLGSITLSCKTEEMVLAQMQWNLFLVAERNENFYELMEKYEQKTKNGTTSSSTVDQPNVYHTVGQFKGTPIMLNDTSASAMVSAASTLENEAVIKEYVPDMTMLSDANGTVYFGGLRQGLYLLSGKRLKVGEYTVIPSPMLVEVIQDQVHDNLHIDSLPKIQLRTMSEGDSKHTVRKIWKKDKGNEIDRGAYVKVNVYKNGELIDTATLNEENGWEMTWYGEEDAEWRVEEVDIPKKYTVVYLANETQYMLENSYNPSYSSSSSNDDWDDDFTSPTETAVTETTATTAASTTIQVTTSRNDSQLTDVMTSTRRSSSTTTVTVTTTTPPGGGSDGGGGGGGGGGSDGGGGGNSDGGGGGSSGGGGSGGGVGKLPQTGQLWWPVPLLGLGGIVFIMTGWRVLRREEH